MNINIEQPQTDKIAVFVCEYVLTNVLDSAIDVISLTSIYLNFINRETTTGIA